MAAAHGEAASPADLPPDVVLEQAVEDVQAAMTLAANGRLDQALTRLETARHTATPVLESGGLARQSEAARAAEAYFPMMRAMIASGAPPQTIAQAGRNLLEALDRSRDALSVMPNGNLLTLFGYGLLVVVREGIEALLVVTALAAAARRCALPGRSGIIAWAVVAALAASLVSAAMLSWLLHRLPTATEVLEGLVLVVAGVMLFAVGNGFLINADLGRFRPGTDTPGFAGSALGLGGTAFLAIYREGAETVLFYTALATESTQRGLIGLAGGFLCGSLLLGGLVMLLRNNMVRLPLGLFLRLSGWLMLIMAFTFAGQAVMELFEGFHLPGTPLPGMPEIHALGLYPYAEPVIAQAVLVAAVVVARRLATRTPATALATPPESPS